MTRNVRAPNWTAQEHEKFIVLHILGLSDKQLSEIMGRTVSSIQKKRYMWGFKYNNGVSGFEFEQILKDIPIEAPKAKNLDPIGLGNRDARMVKLMRQNIMHLVDLKRAGHSPTKTEHALPPEGPGKRFYSPLDEIGTMTSPADLCAMASDGRRF